jgi:hypothetical protein
MVSRIGQPTTLSLLSVTSIGAIDEDHLKALFQQLQDSGFISIEGTKVVYAE